MASSRRLFRLGIGLGALGVAALLLAAWASLRALSLSAPPVEALVSACERFVAPGLTAGALLILLLLAPGFAALALAARSLVRQLRAQRRFEASLDLVGRTRVDGAEVFVLDDDRPRAFCAGFLAPRVYVSSRALELLSGAELSAVVAHERHHRLRRDPLRVFVVRTLAESLFFLPVLRRLAERYGALAELAADDAAVREGGSKPLASALLTFGEGSAPQGALGIAPERVDHLLGEPARWELPLALSLGSLLTVLGLGAAALAAAATLGGAAISLPLLLAQSCMVAMVIVPVFLAVGALLAVRPLLSRR